MRRCDLAGLRLDGVGADGPAGIHTGTTRGRSCLRNIRLGGQNCYWVNNASQSLRQSVKVSIKAKYTLKLPIVDRRRRPPQSSVSLAGVPESVHIAVLLLSLTTATVITAGVLA